MKRTCTAAALILLLLFPVKVRADEDFGAEEVEKALPRAAAEILGDESRIGATLDEGIERLAGYAREHIRSLLVESLRPAAGVLAVVALCTAADGLQGKKEGFDYVNFSACVSIAALNIGDVNSLVCLGRETMTELSDFSRVLLPALTTAAAAGGAVTSAPGKYAATMLFLDVLISAANALVFPVICAYLAAVFADSAVGQGRLTGAVRLLKWACRVTLTALVTAFTLYLGVTGVVASAADGLAAKAAKTALSAALPVVGGIISDAAGSIVAGAGLIRSSIGVLELLGVAAMCLIPFLRLGVRYVVFKAAAALSSVLSGERLSRLIDGVGNACGMVLSLVGVEVIFLYISVLSLIKAVGG